MGSVLEINDDGGAEPALEFGKNAGEHLDAFGQLAQGMADGMALARLTHAVAKRTVGCELPGLQVA